MTIFRMKKAILGSPGVNADGTSPQGVYIDGDATQMEKDLKAKLRVLARAEREKGNTVIVGRNRIAIQNSEWIWDKRAAKFFPTIL